MFYIKIVFCINYKIYVKLLVKYWVIIMKLFRVGSYVEQPVYFRKFDFLKINFKLNVYLKICRKHITNLIVFDVSVLKYLQTELITILS